MKLKHAAYTHYHCWLCFTAKILGNKSVTHIPSVDLYGPSCYMLMHLAGYYVMNAMLVSLPIDQL